MKIKMCFFVLSMLGKIYTSEVNPIITTHMLTYILQVLQEHAYRPNRFGLKVTDLIPECVVFYNEHGAIQSFELPDKGQLIEGVDSTGAFLTVIGKRMQVIRAQGALHFYMRDSFLT